MNKSIEWVTMRRNERDDSWQAIKVDIVAENASDAIEEAAKESGVDAEGDWLAFPNEYFQSYHAVIQRVTQVGLSEPESLV